MQQQPGMQQQPENEIQIGPYELVDRIGQGGTSVVYRAKDTRNDQSVALKVLTPLFATDPKFLRRFINEGKNVKLLDHPHIVRVFDASEADGRQYIAMELIEGGSLSALIKTREHILPIDETISIIKQIADALDYAHSMGILHRDIKLSNILITADGRYVLSDFGSAKQMSMDNTVVTQSGFSVGTPTFMSPEQAKGDPNIDRRTDVYSLGVAAYALLVGKLPFQADSQVALLHKIIYDAPPSPESINPTIPPGISYALKRVLCKEPQMRYSTAGEFASALAEGKSWIPGTMDYAAIPSQYLNRSVQIAAANDQVTEASDKRRLFGLLSLISLLGIILLGLIGTVIFMTNPDLRDSIIARPAIETPGTVGANVPLVQSSASDLDASADILAELESLDAGEFSTFTDDEDRFELDIPDGWIQTVTGNTTNFDANNFMGRLFVHHVENVDPADDPLKLIEAYRSQAEQDGTYKNFERINDSDNGASGITIEDANEEVYTGQWLDSDIVMRLVGVADNADNGYVIGTIVDADQSEQAQQFMDKLVSSFALSQRLPDRVASANSTADSNPDSTSQPANTDAATATETPEPQNTQAATVTSKPNLPTVSPTDSMNEQDNSNGLAESGLAVSTTLTSSTTVGEALATPTISVPDGTLILARIVTATATEASATNTVVPPTATATPVPSTATATDVPATNTAVPATATATSVPATATATDVPATNTAVPATATATSVPSTATATDVPATNTAVPVTATSISATATATDVPATATATSVPSTVTATDVPATDTAVPPTATSVPPTATSVPPTATRVPPTATNVPPTATRVPPTATFTPPPPTITPAPTRPFMFPPGAFQIVNPGLFDTDSGRTYFVWQSSVVPGPGQAYEIVFWKEGQDPLVSAFGVAAPTLANKLTVDLELQDRALGDLLNPGLYNWTILLVNVSPYQRIQILGDVRELVVVRKSN